MYPLIVLIGVGIAAVGTLLDPPKTKPLDNDAPSVPPSAPEPEIVTPDIPNTP